MEEGGWACDVKTSAALYAGVEDVLAELSELPPKIAAAMVVGHEPTSSELIEALLGGGRVRMPTAAMACLDLDAVGWAEVQPGCGELRWLVPPQLARAGNLG